MLAKRSTMFDTARCTVCSMWFAFQNSLWVLRPEQAFTCVCSRYVCDACRHWLYLISPSLQGGETDLAWGVCPGEDVRVENMRHPFRPLLNHTLAGMMINLSEHKLLYCVACRTEAVEKAAAGKHCSAAMSVSTTMSYADWLVHQFQCPFMLWMCPTRCGFFANGQLVKDHIRRGLCMSLPLAWIPDRGSLVGEMRVLPQVGVRPLMVPAARINHDHCEFLEAALPLVTIENKEGGSLFMNVACVLPPAAAMFVFGRVTVWPLDEQFYRPGSTGRYQSAALAMDGDGLAVKVHRVFLDGHGDRDYCMDAECYDIESRSACIDKHMLIPGWYDASEHDGPDRPTRTAICQGLIPARSQVRKSSCLLSVM